MMAQSKSIIVGIALVLVAAFIGGTGVAVALINPFGTLLSAIVTVSLLASAIICWGWACFARKEIYE